jgi:hypothetical protein
MFKTPTEFRPHWNYFLALENDLESISRYIEFSPVNFNTFSIELAHLLLSAASEIDTVAKCVCKLIDPNSSPENINDYRKIIKAREALESSRMRNDSSYWLSSLQLYVPRYGLNLVPWDSWKNDQNPDWWNSYNKVKHERNRHFDKATLFNALHAVSALLALNYLYCRREMVASRPEYFYLATRSEVTCHMEPSSSFLRFGIEFYHNPIEELSENLKRLTTQVSNLEGWFKNSRY